MDTVQVTMEGFRVWLGAVDLDIAGVPRNERECPLALYIQTLVPAADDRVSVRCDDDDVLWCYLDDRRTILMPPWASEFVRDVDEDEGAVTGAHCLDFLRSKR